jgi:hypothetical protein
MDRLGRAAVRREMVRGLEPGADAELVAGHRRAAIYPEPRAPTYLRRPSHYANVERRSPP